jgi:hypothetical protein
VLLTSSCLTSTACARVDQYTMYSLSIAERMVVEQSEPLREPVHVVLFVHQVMLR